LLGNSKKLSYIVRARLGMMIENRENDLILGKNLELDI